jgi:hypothetical protein
MVLVRVGTKVAEKLSLSLSILISFVYNLPN